MSPAVGLITTALLLVCGLGFRPAGGAILRGGPKGNNVHGTDIATLFRNRNLQVRLPRGFAVNNDPPDSGTILQALLSSNGGGGGLSYEQLEVTWSTRQQAEVSVITGTPGYFGSVNVYY